MNSLVSEPRNLKPLPHRRRDLVAWVEEELTLAARVLQAIDSFRFRNELLPAKQLARFNEQRTALRRLVRRAATIESEEELARLEAHAEELSATIDGLREELMRRVPERDRVTQLAVDASVNLGFVEIDEHGACCVVAPPHGASAHAAGPLPNNVIPFRRPARPA